MLILVVEDDPRVGQFLHRGLREEGHEVDLCARGDEAVAQGLSQPYDVILLDWNLPGQDGVSVLRAWRAQGMTTPVILLTARAGVDATVLALDSGADDFIKKPFSFEELLARIRAQHRRGGNTEARVEIGAASLDRRKRILHRGHERLELSAKEFGLLDLLLKHRGEVLSRSRILDRVWGLDFDPSSNVIDVYIRYLRIKIDPPDLQDRRKSIIQTVRGRGYRLRPQCEHGEPR